MKTIDVSALAEQESINISSIFAINQYWRDGSFFIMKNPRPQSALLWFCGCCGRFTSNNGDLLDVPYNSLVYIPEGAQYRVDFFDRRSYPSTVLTEFRLDDGEPFVLSDKMQIVECEVSERPMGELLKRLVTECSLPSKPMLNLKRDVYSALSLICESEKSKSISRRGFETIKAGIEYLQRDERQELSIDEVAGLCFVTPAYFRRLFREYCGMSPAEYRTQRRIKRARELLEHTEITVEALSELLGYSDPSYFWRVFKSRVGCNPSEYKKRLSK